MIRRTVPVRASGRGYTLIETMIVVAIVGVLAVLAVFGVRRYIASAKTSEAMAMVNAIRSAEEAYRDEMFTYLGRSGYAITEANWHPTSTPSDRKHNWAKSTCLAMCTEFRQLGVETNNPVYFGYTVVVGNAGSTSAPQPPTARTFNFPTPQEPYYVVVAKGDLDADGRPSYVVSHSYSGEVYVENEGE